MSDWISMESFPPDNKCMVLCHGDDGYKIRIYFDGGWYDDFGRSTMNVMSEEEDFTHWRYLPEPPDWTNEVMSD